MNGLTHANLATLAEDKLQNSTAARAASAAHADGRSPRGQLDAARKESGAKLVYLPHQGAKERAKRLKRMARGDGGSAI